MTAGGVCPPNCPNRRGATKENPKSCHSDCERYLAARAERMKHYRMREIENDLSDYSIREMKKLGTVVKEI